MKRRKAPPAHVRLVAAEHQFYWRLARRSIDLQPGTGTLRSVGTGTLSNVAQNPHGGGLVACAQVGGHGLRDQGLLDIGDHVIAVLGPGVRQGIGDDVLWRQRLSAGAPQDEDSRDQ